MLRRTGAQKSSAAGTETKTMNKAPVTPAAAEPRLLKRPSMSIPSTTYRVSKAQSLRMRAYDKRVEAAEAKKAKADEAKKAKAAKDAGTA